MRLVWIIIPMVLIGIIGVQESFAENEIVWENSVTKSNDLLIATLATDKKEYSDGESVHIKWSLENVGSENILYKRVGCGAYNHFDFELFRSENFSEWYAQSQLESEIDLPIDFACPDVHHGFPFVKPNEKINKEFIWTQNLIFCDNVEKIPSGNYTLRISFYESKQQFYDKKPDYLDLDISIQEPLAKETMTSPLLSLDKIEIMLTDSDGNEIINPELNKAHYIVFHKPDFHCQNNNYQVTTTIECGAHKQLISNTTSNISVPPSKSAIAFFIPTMVGPYHVTVLSEAGPPMTLDFSIPGEPQNHCDYKFISDLSPVKQIKNEIEPENVICKEELELIFKSSDNSPVCVKPSSAEKLIERGWLVTPSFWIEYQIVQHGNQWDYKISQWVKDNPNVKYTSKIGLQLIKDHYIEKGIKVLDIKFAPDETLSNRLICEANSCPSGQIIMLKIDDPDSPLLNNMYWKKSLQ